MARQPLPITLPVRSAPTPHGCRSASGSLSALLASDALVDAHAWYTVARGRDSDFGSHCVSVGNKA